MTDGVIYGTRGVLAYDEATGRVQCHACGGWYRMLAADHLTRHGLSAAAYKECYGLPRTVRLESPNVTTSRRRNRELLALRHVRPVADDVVYGEHGVLAYDELADRIQCHACGRWYHKLTSFHLKRHGLTIPAYKELYGLNDTTPLETPRITALRRQQALDHDAARYLVAGTNAAAAGHAVWRGRRHRAEYYKRHQTPADRQANSWRQQRWTDDAMLAALRAAQAEAGGILTRYYLDRRGPDGPDERCPTSQAVIRRFGSWQRVCELLGQPYRTTRLPKPPGTHRQWSDEAILAALRDLKEQCGGRLTCEALRRHASGYKGRVGAVPSHKTVQAHLGPWRRVCELLDRT